VKEARRGKTLKIVAATAFIVLVVSSAISLAKLLKIYGCAGKTPEGGTCPELTHAAAIINISHAFSILAMVVLVTSLILLVLASIRNRSNGAD
jgi:hypothetical protein